MTTREILAQFHKLSALVVGDICLDRWCTYNPALAEPSRETGIPRIAITSTQCTPGAGGTIANNLAALSCGRVAVLGATGHDGDAWQLRTSLAARGISPDLLITTPELQTFTYTKFWNDTTGAEDLPRADFINTKALPAHIESQLIGSLIKHAASFDAVLISDQAETECGGVITAAVREAISQLPNRVVWVDSRLRAELFRNAIVKPNHSEALAASLRLTGREDFHALRQAIGRHPLVITHGQKGAQILHDGGETWIATRHVANPIDICGAGDSFSAAAALTLSATGDIEQAARLGNLAASITITKRGTGTASPEEILAVAG